jgi:hypothetical protein
MYKVIGVDQKQYGPVTAEQLRQWIAEGRVNAQTQAQIEGATDWKPLGAFPEFAGSFAPPPTAPPPLPRSPAPVPQSGSENDMAVAGFILSLVGFFCCGFLFSTLGLVFSCVALSQMNNDPQHRRRGLAVAGIVLALVKFLMIFGILALLPFRHFRGYYF